MAMIQWLNYTPSSSNTSVAKQLNDAHVKLVAQNRKYLKNIILLLRYLATQTMPFRGNNEKSESIRKGNSLAGLDLIGSIDPEFKTLLDNAPKNAKYTSSTIQRCLIDIMDQMV